MPTGHSADAINSNLRCLRRAILVSPVEPPRPETSSTNDADTLVHLLDRRLSCPGLHDWGRTMSEVEAAVEGMDAARSRVGGKCLSAHARMQLMGQTPEQGRTQPAVADHASRSFEGLDRIPALQHQCRAGRVGRSAARWVQAAVQLPAAAGSGCFGGHRTRRSFGRSRASSGRDTCRGAAAGFVRTFHRGAARRPKSFNAVATNGGAENRQHPQGASAGFGNGVYLAGCLSLCVLLDSRCLASMSPVQRAALDRTQFNDFRCCSLAA